MSSVAQPYPALLSSLEVIDAKDELRRAIRAEREKRSPRMRAQAAEQLATAVRSLPQVRQASCVAAYASRPVEPGTIPLIEQLAAGGARVLLPVLGAGLQRDWAWYTQTEELEHRAPGRPPEPSGPTLGADALGMAEVVIVPALAVDTAGGRLGQGGGWYDRVLAHARPDVLVVALVFDEEVYDAQQRPLPRQGHDRTVDVVITPSGLRTVGAG